MANEEDDYRAFIFATHHSHGMLLLHCTRKKKKGPHYQVPGGHVDKEDFDAASSTGNSNEGTEQLIAACKIGAARELYEETGLDIRNALDRLTPARLRVPTIPESNELFCEIKKRLFFTLQLTDGDFFTEDTDSKISQRLLLPMNQNHPSLMLKLSHEHQGFRFEPNPENAVDMLIQHSGGKISKALRMALEQGDIKVIASSTDTNNQLVGNAAEQRNVEIPTAKNVEATRERRNIFKCCNC